MNVRTVYLFKKCFRTLSPRPPIGLWHGPNRRHSCLGTHFVKIERSPSPGSRLLGKIPGTPVTVAPLCCTLYRQSGTHSVICRHEWRCACGHSHTPFAKTIIVLRRWLRRFVASRRGVLTVPPSGWREYATTPHAIWHRIVIDSNYLHDPLRWIPNERPSSSVIPSAG